MVAAMTMSKMGMKMMRGGAAGYAAHQMKNAVLRAGRKVDRTASKVERKGVSLGSTAKKVYNRAKSSHGGIIRDPVNAVERGVRQKLNPKLAGYGKLLRTHNALSYGMAAARGKTRK